MDAGLGRGRISCGSVGVGVQLSGVGVGVQLIGDLRTSRRGASPASSALQRAVPPAILAVSWVVAKSSMLGATLRGVTPVDFGGPPGGPIS